MKKIKGLTVLLLVFAMTVSLVTGCGNKEAAPEADATEAPAAEEATETEEEFAFVENGELVIWPRRVQHGTYRLDCDHTYQKCCFERKMI